MPAPVFGALVPLVGRVNTAVLAVNQVRWFKWSLFYQEYVAQGYADIHDPAEPGVVVALKIDGTAATYAALPTTGLTAGMVYVVGDTGRAYVWSGSSWPASNAGIAIQGPRGYTGNGVESVSVAGNSLVFHMTDGNDLPPVFLQVLADLQSSAATAIGARDVAVAARSSAESARDSALGSANDALASRIAAQSTYSNTIALHNAALQYRNDSQAAAATATAKASEASTSATNAAGSEATAAAKASEAAASAANASSSASTAHTKANEAAQARDSASGYATFVEDNVAPYIEDLRQQTLAARNEAQQYAAQASEAVPPATATDFGKIKIRGDLGGTADTPTVPGLTGKRGVVSDAFQVYTTDGSGGQANVGYSSGVTPSTIMFRDAAGRTKVGTPTSGSDAVTKEYVDTLLLKKANLGADGKTLQAEQNAIAVTDFLGNVASQAAMLALVGQRGDWCNRTDLGTEWQLVAEPSTSLSSWMQKVYPASDVTSVAGRKGAVTISSPDITDATATGRALMKATDVAAARTAIGAASLENVESMGYTIESAFTTLNLRDAGLWSMSGTYEVGQVVTYNHGRYYCREAHAATGTFPAAKYVWLGLAAVYAATDPGGGRLWVKAP